MFYFLWGGFKVVPLLEVEVNIYVEVHQCKEDGFKWLLFLLATSPRILNTQWVQGD